MWSKWRYSGLFLLVSMLLAQHVLAQELDFRQRYERGKLLIQKKMYADAIAEFKKASYTQEGRTFFGVYYYLAYAYYWRPDIQQANLALETAKRYAAKKSHRQAIKRLYERIERTYARVTIVPEVDPDEVGRLRLVLKPKIAFSDSHKRRYFRILSKRLRETGVVPNNRPFFIPKGDYEWNISQPQCLRYALMSGGNVVSEISIDAKLTQLALKAGRSCSCTGGQKLVGSGNKLSCACPPGTGWNESKQRCEVGVNPVPWIALGIGVVVAGATAVVVGLVIAQNDGTAYRLLRNPGGDGAKTKLWQ